ncbi:glycerophosphodiester phosphodiesterase [Aquirufa aurantiipilula]|uniref:Glycerophosphodiester phosphodiesterase family protein n=1 Tax=Aquirufa aurantiipilula TaxID=2696561 RepID=A0ABT6BIH9_9BACT|nr:glycerophosphodiester phosphodiesterase family protein [Aquirufa aurantiipilula]MDF5690177.1 glycerophosphodiester phosphodiesterase family protein [Aquirufa aurantiipilula]
MKKYHWLLVLSIAIISSCQRSNSPSQIEAWTYKSQHQLRISAHRGNSGLAPENTLATFQKTLEMGVDFIEIDVRTSKDNQLVILHDGTLNRTTNGTGPIANLSLSEIKQLKANKGWEAQFPNERIPTLEETLQLVSKWNKQKNTKTYIYVDCKQVEPQPLVSLMRKYHLDKESVYYGNDEFLERLKTVDAQSKRMPSLNNANEMETKINRLAPYAFDVNWLKMNAQLVHDIHEKNIKVYTDVLGPLDQSNNYKKAKELGVDLIQTDHVKSVYRYFLGN